MKIKTFLETAGNFNERELLTKFHKGIAERLSQDDTIDISIDREYSPCELGIIMGSWKPREKDHHMVRNAVAENAPCFLVVETALLGRKISEDNKYFRIGVNGFLNNSGIFDYKSHPGDRLARMGINWQGWRENSNGHILLFLQLPGDASLRGANIYSWALDSIQKIRAKTDRPIVIRTHPLHNIKDTDEFYKLLADIFLEKIQNISVSFGKTTPLDTDLASAFCTVAYSSGSSIDSILKGIPAITVDPGNFAYDISSNYLDDIITPKKEVPGVVTNWLSRLAYSQWSIEEMSNGTAWNHLRPLIEIQLAEIQPNKKKK